MRYLIFDTETGGLDAQTDALMSMGAILLDENLNPISSHYALFRNFFKRKVGMRAKEVNGLDEELLEVALTPIEFRPVWNMLSAQTDVFIGHNVAFDIAFLTSNGFTCDSEKTLDTMHLAYDVWTGQRHMSLTNCYRRIGGNPDNAHNALYDCQMVVDLLRWFVLEGHVEKPLPAYPAVADFYDQKAFGYVSLKEKGLI